MIVLFYMKLAFLIILQTYTSKVRHLQYFVMIKSDPFCHNTQQLYIKTYHL